MSGFVKLFFHLYGDVSLNTTILAPVLPSCRISMPSLLDIPISQLSVDAIRGDMFHNGTFRLWKGMKCLSITGNNGKRKINLRMATAASSLEPRCMTRSNDHLGSFSYDHEKMKAEAVEQKERLRRMRISEANQGNTPWNKGKKHKPETIRRIRESTRIAMQDPKVRVRLGKGLRQMHSEETKLLISKKARDYWVKRREKLKVQTGCLIEWQNLIAEASRKGLAGEEELQWDSYKVLDQQLQQEWTVRTLIMKKFFTPRTRGNRRSPKTPEQRSKISAAIAAKWADPEYRARVNSGIWRYHGKGGKNETRMKTEGLKEDNNANSQSQVKTTSEGGERNKKDEGIARSK